MKIFFKYLWLPLLLLVIIVTLLYGIFLRQNESNFSIIFGIALGVALGFIADLTKSKVENWQEHDSLRKQSLKLLEQDAKVIYKTLNMYSAMVNSPDVPLDAKQTVPFDIEMPYWERLNQRNDFLYLASEEPFSEIFKLFWDFERLQGFVKKAKENENAPIPRVVSITAYKAFIDDKKHEKLLRLFMNETEVEEFKKT